MKKYDLHIHTKYSKCSNQEPAKLLAAAKKKALNGIAVTDHNTIRGALETAKLNKDKDFEVIIGEEVMTDKGEVLAYYLKKEIKPGKFEDVIKEIHKQGGVAVLAHPYAIGAIRNSFKGDIDKVYKEIDGIEAINGRCFFKFENLKAQITAKEINIPQTAGSDAHFAFEVGKCWTEFDGKLKDALKKNKTIIHGSTRYSFTARMLSLFARYFRKLN